MSGAKKTTMYTNKTGYRCVFSVQLAEQKKNYILSPVMGLTNRRPLTVTYWPVVLSMAALVHIEKLAYLFPDWLTIMHFRINLFIFLVLYLPTTVNHRKESSPFCFFIKLYFLSLVQLVMLYFHLKSIITVYIS